MYASCMHPNGSALTLGNNIGHKLVQVSFVGQTEEAAREAAQKEGFADKLAVVKTSFKANSKVKATANGLALAAIS